MARRWHYLRAPRNVGWPRTQTALSLTLGATQASDRGQPYWRSTLLAWGAYTWTGREGAVDREHTASGTSAVSFWVYLAQIMRRRERLWVWCTGIAHALAVLGFWRMVDNGDWRFVGGATGAPDCDVESDCCSAAAPLVVSDPPTICVARPSSGSGSVCFLDSRNVGQFALGYYAGNAGAPCGARTGFGGDTGPMGEAAEAVSERDGRRLIEYQRLVVDLKLGGLRTTAAAQAWHGWRISYLCDLVEVHNDTARLEAEREATYGGRINVFRLGLVVGRVQEIDAQAHYPSVCADHALPARVAKGVGGNRWSMDRARDSGYLVIARGAVSTDVPCLPHHYGGETVYPVGQWTGTYCYPEIELLRSEGGRFTPTEWWAYEPSNCCASYMRRLWAERVRLAGEGEHDRRKSCKALSNSLVGRLATRGRAWEDVPRGWFPERWATWSERDPQSREMIDHRSIAGRVQRQLITGWADESIPAISAWVYSVGRVRLWRWLKLAGPNNVHYCDTDSLWTNAEGERRIREAGELRPEVLGGLRVKNVHSWMRVFGVRHYETPAGVKWSGVPERIVSGSEDGWTYTYGESPGQSARRRCQPDGRLITIDVPDRRSATGGRVGADGSVYPREVIDNGRS